MAETTTRGLAAGWAQRPQVGHSMQLYDDEAFLIDEVTQFAGAALGAGDSVIVIATHQHRDALAARLSGNGLNLEYLEKSGRYIALDAAETLDQFMQDEHPVRARFVPLTMNTLMRAVGAAAHKGQNVAAYGEMVALLCAEGNVQAASELEALWNEMIGRYAFYLHCAYPRSLFAGDGDSAALAALCSTHTHLLPSDDGTVPGFVA